MKNAKIFELSNRKFILILFLITLFIRVIYFLIAGNFENPEMYEHGMIAKNMLYGNGFSMHWPYPAVDGPLVEIQKHPPLYEGAFIPPLNPYIIYFSFELFGVNSTSYLILMLLNSLFSSLFVLVIYFLAKEFTNDKNSRVSAIISLLFLPSIIAITTFSGTSLYQLLAGLVLLYAVRVHKYGLLRSYALLGIFSGLLTLVRSEFLMFNLVLALVILFMNSKKKNHKPKKNLIRLLVSLSIFTFIVSPWIIRNTLLFDKFTTIISHPWHEIWRGNNEHSSGGASSTYQLNIWVRKHQYPDIIKKLDKLTYNQNFELEADNIFKSEVMDFWSKNPVKTLSIWINRAIFSFTIDPYTPRARNPVFIFFMLFTLITSFFGLRWILKNKTDKDYSYIIYISFLALYWLLVTLVNLETRYQIYLISLLHTFSGIGFVQFLKAFTSKEKFKLKFTKCGIFVSIIIIAISIYLVSLYIEKEREYRNFKQFEQSNLSGRIETIDQKNEKVNLKLINSDRWFEFHPGYIEDELNYPFLKTAKSGDSVYKASNNEYLTLFTAENLLKYRYIIIYDKK